MLGIMTPYVPESIGKQRLYSTSVFILPQMFQILRGGGHDAKDERLILDLGTNPRPHPGENSITIRVQTM